MYIYSQPAVSLEPTLDIKKLKDPEEFFMAYERHESKFAFLLSLLNNLLPTFCITAVFFFFDCNIDAKREIQKQIGGNLPDSGQYNPSPVVSRRRRPGILGYDRYSASSISLRCLFLTFETQYAFFFYFFFFFFPLSFTSQPFCISQEVSSIQASLFISKF